MATTANSFNSFNSIKNSSPLNSVPQNINSSVDTASLPESNRKRLILFIEEEIQLRKTKDIQESLDVVKNPSSADEEIFSLLELFLEAQSPNLQSQIDSYFAREHKKFQTKAINEHKFGYDSINKGIETTMMLLQSLLHASYMVHQHAAVLAQKKGTIRARKKMIKQYMNLYCYIYKQVLKTWVNLCAYRYKFYGYAIQTQVLMQTLTNYYFKKVCTKSLFKRCFLFEVSDVFMAIKSYIYTIADRSRTEFMVDGPSMVQDDFEWYPGNRAMLFAESMQKTMLTFINNYVSDLCLPRGKKGKPLKNKLSKEFEKLKQIRAELQNKTSLSFAADNADISENNPYDRFLGQLTQFVRLVPYGRKKTSLSSVVGKKKHNGGAANVN